MLTDTIYLAQTFNPLTHNTVVKQFEHLFFSLSPFRAKEIKTKLGTLLQKPENAIDLIIPYPEKPERKPEKLQR